MRILDELAFHGEKVHTVSAADLCALLDISEAALSDLVKRDLAVKRGRNAYDLEQTVHRVVTHLRGIAAGWGTGDMAANLTAERARLAKEQADAQALKNAALRGDLIEADAVAREWADVLRQVRARILAVPSRLRQALDLSAAAADQIDRELREALTELGNGHD